jgi:tripartite-type tricarboxylate transporter receptor subunit TctC
MSTSRRQFTIALGLSLAGLGKRSSAQEAVAWPSRSVRIIVAYVPGGALDTAARMSAERLSAKWGQPVVVENKPGASGTLGADLVAKSTDGHTLLMSASPEMVIAPQTLQNVPYNPERDFAPIMLVCEFPFLLGVHGALPVNSLQELIAYGKSRPEGLAYGSIGVGSASHLTGALFGARSGVALTHVPYRGSAQMLSDVLGGQIQICFDTVPAILPNVAAGRLKAVAAATATRTTVAPNIPTFAEAGIADFVSSGWAGLMGPATTPPHVIAKIARDMTEIMRTELTETLRARGAEPKGSSPEEFQLFIRAEIPKWARMAQQAGVRSN